MHMADGFVSPAVGCTMWAATAAITVLCARRIKQEKEARLVPLMGVLGAFIFACQMLNFTIPGTGSSGHLGGGLILAILLGPYAGFLVMAAILAVQALFFADGGLLALGCTTPAFEAAVMERESISSTAFGQFAIPHTLKMCSPRTCMAVYVSRTPICWGDTAVSLVIMLSFNPNDRKIFYDIFEPLSMILLDSNNLKGALLCKDYAAFIDFLVERME